MGRTKVVVFGVAIALGLGLGPGPARALPQDGDGEAEDTDDPTPPAATGAGLSLIELQNIRLSASSFFEVSRQLAPGTTYIVDREKLATSPNRTLAETIEMAVPGMHVARHLWTGAIIGVRGITIDNNAKTLVMFDGLNLNMRTHFGTHGLLSLPLMGDVERLEVSNGPGSLVHGSGAINGYVNLVARDGASHSGLGATMELGPVDAYGSAQVSYGFTYGKTNNLYVYAGFAGAGGLHPRRDLSWSCTGPKDEQSIICPYEWIEARDMGPSYKWSVNWNHGNLQVIALYARAQLSTEGNAITDWFFFEDPQWMSTLVAVRPQYILSFSDTEDLVLSASGQLQDYGFQPRHPRRPGMGGTMMVDWNYPARVGREGAGSFRALLKTIRIPWSSLAVGAEVGYRRFDRGKQFLAAAGERLGFEDADFHWLELASFVEDTFSWKNLSLTGGLRFEYFKNPRRFQPDTYTEAETRETVVPSPVSLSDHRALVGRFGAALALPHDVSVRASYQRGFRNPDASYYTHWAARDAIKKRMRDRGPAQRAPTGCFGCDPLLADRPSLPRWPMRSNLPGLPALDNETMDSVELNFSQTVSPQLLAYLNSYYNRYQKLLAWIDGEKTFLNDQDDIRSIGGEVGAELVVRGSRISVGYGYSRPLGFGAATYARLGLTNADRTAWKAYSPHQLKVSLSESLLGDRLSMTLAGAFYGKVDDPAWAPGQRHRFLVNASLQYAFTTQIYAKLVLQNLTGNTVPAPRIDNRLTQTGYLGIEQRLAYLSLGLQLH